MLDTGLSYKHTKQVATKEKQRKKMASVHADAEGNGR